MTRKQFGYYQVGPAAFHLKKCDHNILLYQLCRAEWLRGEL